MSTLAGVAVTGVWSALRVPLWLRGRRWTELLSPPAGVAPGRVPPRGAGRAARGAVKVLSAVPGSPWRNTCLYRSVAECLALRSYGIPAVVQERADDHAVMHAGRRAACGPAGDATA
ncbi:MAG TPA: lasso peptide biosynthesis protein [Longimicrobium sp.]|nr:lasso peptide biosynthesis protein [Longimicrobium sp.]